METRPVLDGISLMPAIKEEMENRSQPMGFWQYPSPGRRTPSAQWMAELLEAQKQGNVVTDSARLVLDAGEITKQYPENSFPGHSAWHDWPWKLHRIQNNAGEITLELYHLENDSLEQNNLALSETEKVEALLPQLEKWQNSVVQSLNGKDYH
jgi:hypothetical protein